jgi:hypothetical protein
MLDFLYEPYRIGTQFGFVLHQGDSKIYAERRPALVKRSNIGDVRMCSSTVSTRNPVSYAGIPRSVDYAFEEER